MQRTFFFWMVAFSVAMTAMPRNASAEHSTTEPAKSTKSDLPPAVDPEAPKTKLPDGATLLSRRPLFNKDSGVFFERYRDAKGKEHRRVLLNAEAGGDEYIGSLEFFLTTLKDKSYEAALITKASPYVLNAALLLAGGEPGSPSVLGEKFKAATGSKISITLEYDDKKKKERVSVDGRQWLIDRGQDGKGKAVFNEDFVFPGGRLIQQDGRKVVIETRPDPSPIQTVKGRPPIYTPNTSGDIIGVMNSPDSVLTVPSLSVRGNPRSGQFRFDFNKEIVPPTGTPVVVIFEVKE